MGLDITAYSQLSPDTTVTEDTDYDGSFTRFWHNADFPKHYQGLMEGQAYRFVDSFGFSAGSYGSYGAWRNELAQLAGYGQDQLFENEVPDGHFYTEAAVDSHGGPFFELINFSDCEGSIGPIVAAKLLHDFETYDAVAKNHQDGFYDKYVKWKRAFELAANNGAVSFH